MNLWRSRNSGQIKEMLDPRSFTIATFALCGFANFSSIGIQIGGIGALAPEQRTQLAKFGIRAMLAGTMANLISASIVGIFSDQRMPMATKTKSESRRNSTRAKRAAKFILSKTKLRPKIALVLGSGLGAFADEFTKRHAHSLQKDSAFSAIDGDRARRPARHRQVGGIEVAGMQGRVHLYEGYAAKQVVFPIRVFQRAGIKAVIVTNAAGGIDLSYSQGALVVLRDHINLQAANPLIGPNDDRFGPRFPDMTQAYGKEFRRFVAEEGKRLKLNLHEGVYLALSGRTTKRPLKFMLFERSAPISSACPRFRKFWPRVTARFAFSESPASRIWPRALRRER